MSLSNEEFCLNQLGLKPPSNSSLRLFPSSSQNRFFESFSDVIRENSNISTSNAYYDLESLNNSRIPSTSLGVLHLNIASLPNHINDLKLFLSMSNNKFHVICITETRLQKELDPSVNINIPGYTIEHTPTEAKAGGALIYISNDIDYKTRNDLNVYQSRELESIFVELLLKKKENIVIGCIYKHR